ncbi:hypothetical protein HON36_00715 [Candidatus Parcubacteria bacterium]|jgi:hypothetical protein|nr:hypothetical protein [Candidatus Parcubacteria bacterium]
MTLAWKADMSQKSVKTDVVTENVDDGSITVDIKSQQQGEHIVCCNEGHFKDAFKHLKNFAEVKDKTLKAPGGPMLIAMANGDLHEDLQAPKRVLIEVLKRHSPKRIVLVAHEECLIYDSVGAWQNEPERVRALQLEHLRQAKSIINEWFPKTEVEIYYGEKVGETQLRFYQVIDDPFFDDSPEFSPLRLGESQDSDSN